jgi:hypothetical protein
MMIPTIYHMSKYKSCIRAESKTKNKGFNFLSTQADLNYTKGDQTWL